MTYPDDRVLVAVINRKKDFDYARLCGWYRVPEDRLMNSAGLVYVAFFLSRAFDNLNGGVHFFAEVKGLELAYRHWLLPDEPDHPRAHARYYRLALGGLVRREPPILNPRKRVIAFIETTWAQFVRAKEIDDLYKRTGHYE